MQSTFEPAWENVRAAPRVTIDFGGGHVVERTLHGNIATYVTTADGLVVDVVPGLYDRETFRRRLTESAALARPLAGVAAAEARSRVREHHRAAAARSALGRAIDPFAKGAIEGPVEEALAPPRPPPRVVGTDVLIERLAEGDVGGNAGNAPPERRTGTPVTTLRNVSSSRSLSKSGIETPVERVVSPTPSKRLVEGSTEARIDTRRTAAFPDLSRDTENNEQNRRPAIHRLLAARPGATVAELTKTVYRDVLGVDLDDPLLGLGDTLFETYPFER